MAAESFSVASPPIFSKENYLMHAIKIKTYLKALNLWDVVEQGAVHVPLLRENTIFNESKKHEEQVTKSPKALTCLHSIVSEVIFARIMACETTKEAQDKLKEEFEESDKVKAVRLLTLKREFELLKIKESESVRDYGAKLMKIVNQIRLYGESIR